jgi:hypothetical protein
MTIRRMVFLVPLIMLLSAVPSFAVCSGSGLAFSCPAGATPSDVNGAINSSSDGAVITFANGSYNWPNGGAIQLSNSKGTTLICATVGGCTVNGSGTAIGMGQILGTNNHQYRVSGFNFSNSNGYIIWFGTSVPANGKLTNVRIDHNTVNTATATLVFLGDNAGMTVNYGVIDHNVMNCSQSCSLMMEIAGRPYSPPDPSPMGTANNLFVEDNTINIATMTNNGSGCSDSWGGAQIVWRHNTSTNCPVDTHGATHAGGPQNWEVYSNSIRMNSGASGSGLENGYRNFHHQGSGELLFFNNTFTPASGASKSSTPAVVEDYRAFPNSVDGGAPPCDGTVTSTFSDGFGDGNRSPTTTNRGYPCWHQAGRTFGPNGGTYKPMYTWNNRWSDGTKLDLELDDFGGGWFSSHMQDDRELYTSVSVNSQTSPSSPFNGTTGMGFGTLANRPATCTTSSEPGAGVGYFATDQGPQGTLYTCSAANTWTAYYTPYTYPHPLVSGGGGGGGGTPVNPPTGLGATVQ